MRIAIFMIRAFLRLLQPLQRISQLLSKNLADAVCTYLIPRTGQLLPDVLQTFTGPLQRRHRVPTRGRIDDFLNDAHYFRVFILNGFPASSRAALTPLHRNRLVTTLGFQLLCPCNYCHCTHAKRFRYCPNSSSSKTDCLVPCPQSPHPLVEKRANAFIPRRHRFLLKVRLELCHFQYGSIEASPRKSKHRSRPMDPMPLAPEGPMGLFPGLKKDEAPEAAASGASRLFLRVVHPEYDEVH